VIDITFKEWRADEGVWHVIIKTGSPMAPRHRPTTLHLPETATDADLMAEILRLEDERGWA
jgi:hypothetical protein